MATSPTLADPARANARVCPGRPVFKYKERGGRVRRGLPPWRTTGRPSAKRLAKDVYGIERLDYSKKLGFTQPSLPRTGRASLLASSATSTRTWRVMKSASLACLVDRFTGCPIPRFRRQATRLHDSDDRESNAV
jgi:hypothetical protein